MARINMPACKELCRGRCDGARMLRKGVRRFAGKHWSVYQLRAGDGDIPTHRPIFSISVTVIEDN